MNQQRVSLSRLLGSSLLVYTEFTGSSDFSWSCCWAQDPQKLVLHHDGCPANRPKSLLVHSHLHLQIQQARHLFHSCRTILAGNDVCTRLQPLVTTTRPNR
ncbi:hypothetical protein AVEN_12038-1 [Araneus ventricosus]|uniref:Uncharacterized protein n=1 Tax=Araneus ventricosus TaxID=182803 RepID=A0A4Y2P8Q9_ARAVE|nr:hypothetical protein AVEN_12038-1 [Araneus ventricosus]